jgi:hypothetical protein
MLAMKKLAAGLHSAEPKKFILKFFKAGGTRFLAFQSVSRAIIF